MDANYGINFTKKEIDDFSLDEMLSSIKLQLTDEDQRLVDLVHKVMDDVLYRKVEKLMNNEHDNVE